MFQYLFGTMRLLDHVRKLSSDVHDLILLAVKMVDETKDALGHFKSFENIITGKQNTLIFQGRMIDKTALAIEASPNNVTMGVLEALSDGFTRFIGDQIFFHGRAAIIDLADIAGVSKSFGLPNNAFRETGLVQKLETKELCGPRFKFYHWSILKYLQNARKSGKIIWIKIAGDVNNGLLVRQIDLFGWKDERILDEYIDVTYELTKAAKSPMGGTAENMLHAFGTHMGAHSYWKSPKLKAKKKFEALLKQANSDEILLFKRSYLQTGRTQILKIADQLGYQELKFNRRGNYDPKLDQKFQNLQLYVELIKKKKKRTHNPWFCQTVPADQAFMAMYQPMAKATIIQRFEVSQAMNDSLKNGSNLPPEWNRSNQVFFDPNFTKVICPIDGRPKEIRDSCEDLLDLTRRGPTQLIFVGGTEKEALEVMSYLGSYSHNIPDIETTRRAESHTSLFSHHVTRQALAMSKGKSRTYGGELVDSFYEVASDAYGDQTIWHEDLKLSLGHATDSRTSPTDQSEWIVDLLIAFRAHDGPYKGKVFLWYIEDKIVGTTGAWNHNLWYARGLSKIYHLATGNIGKIRSSSERAAENWGGKRGIWDKVDKVKLQALIGTIDNAEVIGEIGSLRLTDAVFEGGKLEKLIIRIELLDCPSTTISTALNNFIYSGEDNSGFARELKMTLQYIDEGLIEFGNHNSLLSRSYWLQDGWGQFRPFRELSDNLYNIVLKEAGNLKWKVKKLPNFQRETSLAYKKLNEIYDKLELLAELRIKLILHFNLLH